MIGSENMTYAEELQARLLDSRNADGGWPSRHGCSWTEPTALTLLALQGAKVSSQTRSLTASWLSHRQLPDGGWSPCAEVPTSTWVTSLALLSLVQESDYSTGCPKGALWLAGHVYPELNAFQGYLKDHLGIAPSRAPGSSAWFPGTAGWVIPTSFSILALSHWSRQVRTSAFENKIHLAQDYLLSRRCSDSGWNHGGSPQRSETAPSYAETTGLALLALASKPSSSLQATIQLAKRFLQKPDSTEGFCWLQIGLAAHGVELKDTPLWTAQPKTTQEIALRLLTIQTLEGRNPFLPSVT